MQHEERAALAARGRTEGELRLAAAAQARQLAEAKVLQEVEARIQAEEEALQAANARSRAESAAALQARELSDSFMRMAHAVTRKARRARWLKHVAFAGAALSALVWLGASWYLEDSPAFPASAAVRVTPAPAALDEQTPAADTGTALNLRIAGALQYPPAER